MLQETKSTNDDFPYDIIKEQGYDINNIGQKSYNGVAILSKVPVEIKNTALPKNDKDPQARFLEVKVLDKNPFDIASIYLPNGNPIDTEKFSYKLDWMKKLKSYIEKKMENYETFIFGGDFNIIPNNDDAVSIEKWRNDALHHPKSIEINQKSIRNLSESIKIHHMIYIRLPALNVKNADFYIFYPFIYDLCWTSKPNPYDFIPLIG